MGERIKIGDFGFFIFRFCREMVMQVNGKKQKVVFNDTKELEGMEVIDVDKKTVLLRGMEGEKVLVDRKDIKSFEPMERPLVHNSHPKS